MPLNQPEADLFQRMKSQETSESTAWPSIEEFRASRDMSADYVGEPAPVHFKNDFVVARDGYSIPIRIYHDELGADKNVLVFLPGCGYIRDAFEVNAVVASKIAHFSGAKVIVVNYRLAPENPLPIPIYDAYDVVKDLTQDPGRFDIDNDKICIGGLSSGANAAAIVSNLSQITSEIKITHQILLNGIYDLTRSHGREYESYEKEDQFLTSKAIDYICSFWGISKDDYTNPLFSPYFQNDFSALPKTTIIVAEYDGLRGNSEAYFAKLKAAGCNVEKIIILGQTHETVLLRELLPDDPDPAKVMAECIKGH